MHFSLSSAASSFISILVIDWAADIDWMERKGLLLKEREREREGLFWRARANMQIMSLTQCRCSPGPIEFLSEAVSLSRCADSSCPESV